MPNTEPDTEPSQPTATETLSPMLEGLLTGNIPSKGRPLHTPPQNKADAKAQIQDMLQEHAVEMDALAKL